MYISVMTLVVCFEKIVLKVVRFLYLKNIDSNSISL